MNVLIDYGYVNPSKLSGSVTLTSKNKNARGKRYYAKDRLAFYAWKITGENHEDKDYQAWVKTEEEKKNKRRSKKRD